MGRGGTCCWDGKDEGQLNGSFEGEHLERLRGVQNEDSV